MSFSTIASICASSSVSALSIAFLSTILCRGLEALNHIHPLHPIQASNAISLYQIYKYFHSDRSISELTFPTNQKAIHLVVIENERNQLKSSRLVPRKARHILFLLKSILSANLNPIDK